MGGLAAVERGPAGRARRARIDAALRREDRRYRPGLWSYIFLGDALTAVTAPVVYALLMPFVLLDVSVMAYQAICFRAWHIGRVRRRPYFAIDRHRLPYLNALEKLNCLFCSYANGVIAFVREVAARTEQYWCPIRHARRIRDPHARYDAFSDYGAAAAYRAGLPSLRDGLRK